MPLISQQVLSLIGGVSQQADKQRASSQMESQVNCFDSITYGKIKRPPTTHVAQLSNQQWSAPALHAVNRSAAEKYHIIVTGGKCYVYDGITGLQYPVLTPQGTSYLNLVSPAFLVVYQQDSFSGIVGHTLAGGYIAPSGASWSVIRGTNSLQGGNYSDSFTFNGVQPLLPGTTGGGYVYNVTPTVADYNATLAVNPIGSSAAMGLRIWARMTQPSTTGYPSGYFIAIPRISTLDGATVGVTLNRQDPNGTITVLGTYYGLTSGNWGANRSIGIRVSGPSVSIYGTPPAGGVSANLLTATDATYISPGLSGFDGFDASGGSYYDLTGWVLDYGYYPANPQQDSFRFCTVQDTTFIVNQTKVVEPLFTSSSTVRQPEALITVALADYGTNFYVTINGITVGLQTGAPSAPGSRAQLGTDQIAQQLYSALQANATLSAAFQFQLLGEIGTTQGASTIYVTRTNGADFTIAANDGLSDSGLVVVKGTVQTISQLPARALNGMVVQVQPNPNNKIDTAYYYYNNLGSPNLGGVWQETVAPGILNQLDPKTMPWQLTRSGDVLSGYLADGNPPLPTIGPGAISIHTEGEGGHGATFRPTIGDNGSNFTYTLADLTGATNQTLIFTYDVDMGNLPIGEYATVSIEDNHTSTTYTQTFGGGSSVLNFPQTITTSSPANSTFTCTLNYSRGSTPPANLQGQVAFHAQTDYTGYNCVIEQIPAGILIAWNTQWTYAGGVQITVTVGGTPYTYTPTADSTPAQIATAIAALTYSGYTGSVVNVTETLLTKASGVPGACTVAYAWNSTTNYHNASLNLATNELVGLNFEDLTDGSVGQISANTATTVTFGALSGGITNTVRLNDTVAVSAPGGQSFFVLQPCNWSKRLVGDDITNPFPPITYNTITEIGFTSGRLVMLSGENILCTGSDDIFDCFRTTVTQLLDTDRIAVQSNSDSVSDWHSLVHWAEGVWLFAGNVQAQLPTEPALANSTVSIQTQTKYQSEPTLRPLAMDRRIFFARLRSPNSAAPVTEILRYQRIRFPFFGFIAESATKAIPTYLQGSPLYLVGDPVLEVMIVLTSAVPNQLYPYLYHYDEQQQLQFESWSTWAIDPGAKILAIDFLDGVLGMVIQRTDGVYLEYMDLQLGLYEVQA